MSKKKKKKKKKKNAIVFNGFDTQMKRFHLASDFFVLTFI